MQQAIIGQFFTTQLPGSSSIQSNSEDAFLQILSLQQDSQSLLVCLFVRSFGRLESKLKRIHADRQPQSRRRHDRGRKEEIN